MRVYGAGAALFVDRIGMELYPEGRGGGRGGRGGAATAAAAAQPLERMHMNEDEPSALHAKYFVAALHGPENAAERRAYTAGSSVQGDGRRFQELGTGGRLDVGEQILIGGKAIEEFGVGVGLDFGQPAPPSVVNQRADEPDEQADRQA